MLRAGPLPLLLLATALPALAQSPRSPDPFSTVAISLGAVFEADRSRNLERWDTSPGLEARVLFPFYAGSVELGAAQASFESADPDIPGFRARYIFIGWGAGVRPLTRITWRTGARLGVYDLQFDDESIPDYARSENEVASELMTELDIAFGHGWSVAAAAGGRVVFTEPRMRQLALSASIRRTFASPEWLRDFLD